MATTAANAERYDGAQRRIQTAMERISRNAGFPPPTQPSVKIEDAATRNANDADRVATFLEQVANSYDPAGAAKAASPAALGGIQDGYNEMEEQAKAARKGKKGAAGEEADEGDNRVLHGHKLSVYRNKVGDKTGDERLQVLQGYEGVGPAKAQEIADALDGKS